MAKVKLDLRGIAIPQKIQFGRQVVTAMTGNANYTTPNPALAVLTTAINELEASFNDRQAKAQAAQQATTVQGIKEAALDGLLTQEAAYVETTSAGDTAKIQSAGMDVRAAGAPVGELPAPAGFVATAGDADGEIDLDWDNVRGAKSYQVQYSPDPITATSWVNADPVTRSKTTVKNLTSGSKYWFRARAVGAAGPGPWSDPATKIAP